MDQRSLFDSDEDLAAWLARMTGQTGPQGFSGQASLAPGVQARISAQGGPQPGGTAGLSLGPLSLNGGLSTMPTPDGGTSLTPNFGAGLKVPVAGGDASANFNITPGQLKELELEYRRKLLGGEISAQGNYSQPDQGNPGFSGRIRYTRKF